LIKVAFIQPVVVNNTILVTFSSITNLYK